MAPNQDINKATKRIIHTKLYICVFIQWIFDFLCCVLCFLKQIGFNHHILGRLISDCSITSINDIVFVFDHIQLKIIIAFDNLLQIKHYFSLILKQVPNSSKKTLIWLNI
jgi:hypothetical protein